MTYKIISQVEVQLSQIERARAVLSEADEYFTLERERQWLPRYAGQISLLLHVVDGLLCDVIPELETVTDELLTIHKEER